MVCINIFGSIGKVDNNNILWKWPLMVSTPGKLQNFRRKFGFARSNRRITRAKDPANPAGKYGNLIQFQVSIVRMKPNVARIRV